MSNSSFTYSQLGFQYGEISDDYAGNIDSPYYSRSTHEMENFIPYPEGQAKVIYGMEFLNTLSEKKTVRIFKTISFSRNNVTWIVCIGVNSIDMYDANNISTTHTFSSPYSDDELDTLRFSDDTDYLFIVCPTKPIHTLRRAEGADTYTFKEFIIKYGANEDVAVIDKEELDISITSDLYKTNSTATLTASAALFTSDMIGSNFAIFEPSGNLAIYPLWVTGQAMSAGQRRTNEGRLYESTTAGTTGTFSPSHTGDGEILSDGGVNWLYLNEGYGFIRITTFASTTSVSGTISRALPPTVVSTPTFRWSEGAFSERKGYPKDTAISEQRLYLIKDRSIYMSAIGEYDNFDSQQGLADKGINLKIEELINFIYVSSEVTIGTEKNVQRLTLIPNLRITKDLGVNTQDIPPVHINEEIAFLGETGKLLLRAVYNQERGSLQSETLSLTNRNIISKKAKILCAIQSPIDLILVVDEEGNTVGMTLELTQRIIAPFKINLGKVYSMHNIDNNVYVVKQRDTGEYDLFKWTLNDKPHTLNDFYVIPQGDNTNLTLPDFYHGKTVRLMSKKGNVFSEIEDITIANDGKYGRVTQEEDYIGTPINAKIKSHIPSIYLPPQVAGYMNDAMMSRINLFFTGAVQFKVDNQEVPFRKGSDKMDETIPPYSGTKNISIGKLTSNRIIFVANSGHNCSFRNYSITFSGSVR